MPLLISTESQLSDRRNDQRPASADRRTESPYTQSSSNRDRGDRDRDRGDRDRDSASVPTSQASQQSNQQTQPAADGKPWNYPGLDLMATGAFWQNYSGELAFDEIFRHLFSKEVATEVDFTHSRMKRTFFIEKAKFYS